MSLRSDSTNLDFLRATAVLLVLVSHVLFAIYGQPCDWIAKPMGRIGVLFFFVHTCTVLMLSLERRPDTVRFYVRRFFRIYPLSVFTVLVYAAFHIPSTGWFLNEYPNVSGKGIIANLLLIQNLTFSKDVIASLWSLPLEVQMYIVLPLLYRARKIRVESLWVGSVAIAMVWPFLGRIPHSGLSRLAELSSFVPCFLPGVLAYRHSKVTQRKLPAYLWIPLVIAVTAAYCWKPSEYSGWAACLCLGYAIPRFRELNANRIAHTIAKYSYGIYLGHFFCLYLGFICLHSQPFMLRCAVSTVALVVIPPLLYHGLEEPMIRVGARLTGSKAKPARALAAQA
jgi:peptidoglycan/LPS O-acetylase OafA/YrhL